jgi:hypothetical protein
MKYKEDINMLKDKLKRIWFVMVLSVFFLSGCAAATTTPSTASQTTASQTTAEPTVISVQTDNSGTTENITPSPNPSETLNVTADDQDGDGIPDVVEKTYGTNPYAADTDGDGVYDKTDEKPVFAENPINETSTTPLPITITDARVEDNATADHLEITLKNTGSSSLSGFDVYFTITDHVTGVAEAYYVVLAGLTIPSGASATVHFDNDTTQPNHYFGNMNGLYGTSANGLTFNVQLHVGGYQPISFTVEKAQGTAEVAD